MKQNNKKKDEADNPNRIRTLYLCNIIFLSCLTILSLLFAMIVFFSLRVRGTDGFRKFYTDAQIREMREEMSAKERELLLSKIQESLESGMSTTQTFRLVFPDRIVVVSGGEYTFYPVAENVEKNPLPSGMLICDEEQNVKYLGTYPELDLVPGTLLTDDNGKIDWDRLSGSGIREAAIRVGTIRTNGFVPDRQAARNCRKAMEKGISVLLVLQAEEPAGEKVLAEAAQTAAQIAVDRGILPEEVLSAGDEEAESAVEEEEGADSGVSSASYTGGETAGNTGLTGAEAVESVPDEEAVSVSETAAGVSLVVRIQNVEELSEDGSDRSKWTDSVRTLCGMLEKKRISPMIGGSIQTFAAQIDISKIPQYERWLSDHEDMVIFPYSIDCWEYSRDGHLDGVPGESFLYTHIIYTENLSVETK